MKRILILGGGTIEPIRNHLGLCAPAFGTTAKSLAKMIEASELVLTKMADSNSSLISNDDVDSYLTGVLEDQNVKAIILNIAFCDYKPIDIEGVKSGFHAERLRTEDGDLTLTLTPTDKIIKKIRLKRPDIFLVGFKTTTNKSSEDQFLIGLKMMKSTKCNLVFCNDTITRNNMIITPEESIYGETTDRQKALAELVEIFSLRTGLHYHRTKHNEVESFDIVNNTPESFRRVIQFLIDNGGFLENNGNGFTPGHFCYKTADDVFLSSQRKANHNLVFSEGMSLVKIQDDTIHVSGKRKASVGAMSQNMMLKAYPEYDCIVHTHNPLKEVSLIPIAEQKPFQCGSIECGINTLTNLKDFNGIKAVYLNKHGANILFKSSDDPEKIIRFIKENIELGIKVK